jgi:SNF2 family DNA or RNA helicase
MSSRILMLEVQYDPNKEIQAGYRSFRIGQNEDVEIFRTIIKNSWEETIFKKNLKKVKEY